LEITWAVSLMICTVVSSGFLHGRNFFAYIFLWE
jgi:hypothetical protein